MNNDTKPISIMLCTAARGGMRTVVESYDNDGLFDKWNTRLIYTHDDGGWLKKILIFIRALLIFCYLISLKKVLFVHVHSAMRGSFWRKNVFSGICRAVKLPVVLHLHGSEMKAFYNAQGKGGQKRIINILTKADRVVVLSKSWREFIINIAPNAKVDIIYNYVKIPNKERANSKSSDIKILFLGLIGKRKGAFDLINAAKLLSTTYTNTKVLIGGNGEENKAKELVERLGLQENVIFLGWVSGNKKLELLAEADIFILPSYNEGLPMSLLEAMSWGIPVISTNVGGIPELVRDSVDGFVINPGDIDAIYLALSKLIDSSEQRDILGENARERIETLFSDKIILPQWDNLYKSISRWD